MPHTTRLNAEMSTDITTVATWYKSIQISMCDFPSYQAIKLSSNSDKILQCLVGALIAFIANVCQIEIIFWSAELNLHVLQ